MLMPFRKKVDEMKFSKEKFALLENNTELLINDLIKIADLQKPFWLESLNIAKYQEIGRSF